MVLCVVVFIYGLCEQSYDYITIGAVFAAVVGIAGFGAWGMSTDHTNRVLLSPTQYEILRAKNYVVFSISEKIQITSNSYEVVSNPDHVKVYLCTNIDHYGHENSTKYLEIQP